MNENVINNVSNAVSNTAKKTMKWFVPPANQSANPSVRSGALTPNTGFKPINSTLITGTQVIDPVEGVSILRCSSHN